jgi:hypothetical protein
MYFLPNFDENFLRQTVRIFQKLPEIQTASLNTGIGFFSFGPA